MTVRRTPSARARANTRHRVTARSSAPRVTVNVKPPAEMAARRSAAPSLPRKAFPRAAAGSFSGASEMVGGLGVRRRYARSPPRRDQLRRNIKARLAMHEAEPLKKQVNASVVENRRQRHFQYKIEQCHRQVDR